MTEFPLYPALDRERRLPELPVSAYTRHTAPADYVVDPGLRDAINVALFLGQPLLLTGEPGAGKTSLARHLSWNFGLGEPLVFQAKTSSVARDLFYTFDAVGRFRAPAFTDPRAYIVFQALGKALLAANPPAIVADLLPEGVRHTTPMRSIVLIDEVDKAPRDFPNDILTEVERMEFQIPELGGMVVRAPEELRPIVLITSNSEKQLPDAFLRRCVYYHIPFPEDRLEEIVLRRVCRDGGDLPFLSEALKLFLGLRQPSTRLRKRPGTAELLGWVEYLANRLPRDASLADYPAILYGSLGIVVKTAEDQESGREFLNHWLTR